jgi:membrane protease YdiL (CAAX protease family)
MSDRILLVRSDPTRRDWEDRHVTVAIVGAVLGLVAWAFVFVPPREGIWVRNRIVAAVLIGYSVVVLSWTGDLAHALGRPDPGSIAIGLGVGVTWLVVTQVGHRLLAHLVPSIVARAGDLYRIAVGDRCRDVIVAVVTMGVAEELLFRGVVQFHWGLIGGVAVYAAVQLVARNWALVLAGLLCGAVFGVVYEWSGDIVAPILTHLVWTGGLVFVWPLTDATGARIPEADEVALTG